MVPFKSFCYIVTTNQWWRVPCWRRYLIDNDKKRLDKLTSNTGSTLGLSLKDVRTVVQRRSRSITHIPQFSHIFFILSPKIITNNKS